MRRASPSSRVVALLRSPAPWRPSALQAAERTERGHRPGHGQGAAGDAGRLGQARRRRRTSTRSATTTSTPTRPSSPSTRTPAPRGRPRATAATLAGKKGVGLYVDAAPGVAATSIEIDTPKPGWQAEIHVAPDGAAPDAPGEPDSMEAGRRRQGQAQAPALHAAHRRQGLPLLPRLDHEAAAGAERVEISDVSLFRKAVELEGVAARSAR